MPGILGWAVLGCIRWQADGLGEPDEVQAATGCYRAAMDVLGQFVAECCELGRATSARHRTCERTTNMVQGQRRATRQRPTVRRLSDGRGVTKRKSNGVYYVGIDWFETGTVGTVGTVVPVNALRRVRRLTEMALFSDRSGS